MPAAWSHHLIPRFAEVLDAFHLHNEDEGSRNEVSCSFERGVLGRYLAWLQNVTFSADPLDDPKARDQAVAAHLRILLINGARRQSINAELAMLRRFYAWRGTGAHTIASLSSDHPGFR